MEPAIIDTPEHWRSWLNSGLSHVLGPLPWLDDARKASDAAAGEVWPDAGQAAAGDLPGRELVDLSLPEGPGMRPQPGAGRALTAPAPPSEQGRAMAPAADLGAAPQTGPGAGQDGLRADSARATPAATPATAPATTPKATPVQRPLPSAAWPQAWKNAWTKTGFARPFLWTYEQLGEDLLGTPDPERREILQRLLGALNLGPVHNFWPFSEPDGQGALRLQPKIFFEGLTRLAPKCVIFLGGQEIAGITAPGVPELFKLMSYQDTGVFCVHFPDIHELAANPALLQQMAGLFEQRLSRFI